MTRTVRVITLTGLGLITSFLVAAASQTITFPAISNQILGVSPFAITGSASSGLPVSFLSTTPAVCKLAGNLLTLLSVGPCFITAGQAGNGAYSAATSVTQGFTVVSAKASGTLAAANSPVALGYEPTSVAVADFNGDGIPDVATCNFLDNTVSILLGDGAGGFAAAPSLSSTGLSYGFVVAADFNGDGITDLALSGYSSSNVSNSITIFLGNGSGRFTQNSVTPYPYNGAFRLVVGDFNGDGLPDLVAYGSATNLDLLISNGAGGFSSVTVLHPASGIFGDAAQAIAADFNGDGALDLAFANNSGTNTITVLLGNGTGGFTPAPGAPTTTGNEPLSLAVGDFNRDGIADLVVADELDNSVMVLLGNGLGDFTTAPGSPFSASTDPLSVAVGDFNGDGIQDIVAGTVFGVYVLLGDGAGGFTPATGGLANANVPYFLSVADFNGDGIEDLLTVGGGEGSTYIVLLGGPAVAGAVLSTSSPATIATGQSVALTLTVSDTGVAFSAPTGTAKFYDGTTLLGTSNQNASPFSFSASGLGNGSHSLTAVYGGDSRTSTSTSNIVAIQVLQPQTITFGPLSNVVLGSGNIALAASASSGNTVSYAASPQGVCAVSGASVSLVGFGTCSITASQAGDGTYQAAAPVTEMFTISPVSPAVTSIAPNTVQAFSAATPVTIAGSNFLSSATVTMTGPDGVMRGITPDLIQTAQIAATIPAAFLTTAGTAQVAVNNGYAALSNPVSFTITPGNQTIAFDAVPNQILGVSPFVIAAQASSRLPVTFASTTPAVCTNATNLVTLLSAGTCSITANQVGSSNYLAASGTRSFTVSTAKVSGSFTEAPGSPFSTATGTRTVAVGDFNGDGVPDLAAVNQTGTLTILLGNGSGSFTTASGSPVFGGPNPWSVAVGDFNGDGVQDLAVGNYGSVAILLGNGSGGFSPAPGNPLSTTGNVDSIAVGDFNGDGFEDLAAVGQAAQGNDPGYIAMWYGNGAGGFAPVQAGVPAVGYGPGSVVVGDFNRDGIQDIAVGSDDSVTVLLGSISGFTAAAGNPIAFGGSIALGDFNGDGIQDMAVMNGGVGTVSILLGDGSGGFVAAAGNPLAVETEPEGIVAGDFNGDGKQDVATVNLASNNVTVLFGDGAGGLATAAFSPLAVGSHPEFLVTGDFNGDGIEDLATANSTGNNVTVLLGLAVGTTTQTISFGPLSDMNISVSSFALSATASSSLPVSFASASPGWCKVTGNTVTMSSAGPCSIVASQKGNATYAAAATVTQSFNVLPAPQTIIFGPLGSVSLGTAPFAVTSTASSGLPVTFSSTTNSVCTVSQAGTVTILALGTCSITATTAPSFMYATVSAMQSFSVVAGATCSSATSPNIPVEIRAEGTRELVSNTVISCTGGNGLPMNIAISMPMVTSAVLGSGPGAISEALAGLNSSATTLAADAVSGVVSGNSVLFSGIPTSTGAFTITVTNIRINATQVANPPIFVSEAIQVSGAGATPAALPTTVVALVHNGLSPAVVTGAAAIPVCTAISPAAPGFNLQFGQLFARAFKTQGDATANSDLTYWYTGNTETGYSVSLNGVSNTATSGTRVRIVFNNVPVNVTVYVPVAASGNAGTLTLTQSETGPFSAVPALTLTGVPAGTAALAVTNGSATAIYEVTADDVTVIENYTIPVYLAAAAGTAPSQVSAMTATVSMAPIGASGNLPNFVNASTTTTVSASTFTACGASITFPPVSDQAVGAAVTLMATATSGAPVSYASMTPGVCSVARNIATATAAGKCTITASSSGNAFYTAPVPVNQSFNVTVVAPVATSITPNTVAAYSAAAGVTIAGSNFVGAAQISFTPPGGTTQTITPSLVAAAQLMATIPAAFLTTAGTAQVAVTNGFTAFSNQVQFTITAATQTISFDAIPNQILGGSPILTAAKASSGLSVGFVSTTTGVCKVAANQVRLVATGTCSITATQAGNGGYAAVSATRSFVVSQAKPSGTLIAAPTSSVGLPPDSFYPITADFNGDGILDMAATDGLGNLTVLLGNGSGGFKSTTSRPWPAGTAAWAIAVGDFNGDGIPDLATANVTGNYSVNNITVLLGDGVGGFALITTVAQGIGPYSITVGDFNGDGIQDLASVNADDSTVTVLLGNGSGNFTPARGSPFATGEFPAVVVVGDFNGDGIQDLATANNSQVGPPNVSILSGSGDGRFPAISTTIPLDSGYPTGLTVGDFNGDGRSDLAVFSEAIGGVGSNLATVLLANRSGGFQVAPGSPMNLETAFAPSLAADFNGDGITDLVTAQSGSNTVTMLQGNGAGAYALSGAQFTFASGPDAAVAGDFNGDGIMDLAAVNYHAGTVTVYFGGIARTESSLSTASAATIAVGQSVPLTLAVSGTTPTYSAPTGTVTFSDGATVLGTSGQTTSQYMFMASGLGLGTHKLSAVYSGDSRSSGSASNTVTIQVLQAQTISFAPLANVPVGTASFAVNATANSGYPVSFTSGNPLVCSLSGNMVTILTSGGCSIIASQAGDSTYASATPVSQSFTVFFGDVASGDNDYAAINSMAQYGITAGCGSNDFCPNNNVTRDEMAIFIVRAIFGNDNFTYTTTPYFTDVTPATFGFKWIQKLKDLGITGGCTATTYCPGEVVTRDQMAIFIIRARLGISIAGPGPTFTYPATPYFTDATAANEFAFPWIQRMKMDGITNGCTATTYCSSSPVTRGQMAIFIMRGAFNQFLPAGTPVISSISPSTLVRGGSGTFTITGVNTNFVQGTTVLSPIPGVTIGAVTVNSATSITVQLTAASGAVAQPYSVLAITGAEQDVLPNGLLLQ